jgi:tRNA(Ile)-lysidine synthase
VAAGRGGAARIARHAAGARSAADRRDPHALGHTADDQAETVFMRVLQGAGPRGLAGIPVRRGRIVRPLLAVDRAAVRAHLAAHGLDSVEDATNRDTAFLRNRVRHELLPSLAERAGVPLAEALRRVARASREAVEALDTLVRPRLAGHLTRTPVGWRLALAACADLPAGVAKRCSLRWWRRRPRTVWGSGPGRHLDAGGTADRRQGAGILPASS